MMDDRELLHRYVEARSEAAFAEFVQRHLRLVYGCALRHSGGRRDLAQDVAQTVFLQAARKARRLTNRSSLAGWLHTAARFAAIDLMRAERRRMARERIFGTFGEHEATTVSLAEGTKRAIDDLLAKLSAADRESLLLFYVEEVPAAEIAQQTGITEAALRKRIERSLDKLRLRLAKRGIGSTSAAIAATLTEVGAADVPVHLVQSICQTVSSLGTLPGSLTMKWVDATQAMGGLTGIVAVLALGFAGVEWQADRTARSNWKAIVAARNGASDQLRHSQRALATVQATENKLLQRAADSARNTAEAKEAARKEIERQRQRGVAFLAAHPEVQALIAQEAHDHGDWWAGPAGRRNGFTPEQIAQIEAIDALRRGSEYTIGTPEGAVKLNQSLGDLTDAQADAQERTILGDQGFAQYQDYNRNFRGIQEATAAAGILTDLGEPISPRETLALEQIFAAASPEYRSGGGVNPANFEWDTIIQESAKLLTPSQMQAVNALRDSVAAWQAERAAAAAP